MLNRSNLCGSMALTLAAVAIACSSPDTQAGRSSVVTNDNTGGADDGAFIEPETPIPDDNDQALLEGGESTSGGAMGNGDLVDGMVCNAKDVAFEKVIPTVMILVDRSSSMFDFPYGTEQSRWEPMRQAVLTLEAFTEDVAFSFVTYTAIGGEAQCPTYENMAMVPTIGNFEEIKGALKDAMTARPPAKGETPTGEAIAAAVDTLAAVPSDGPKYLLVITDGEPDTCSVRDPQCGQDWSIASAQAAYEQGILTYVVGISEDVKDNFLNDLAHAGQGLPVPEPPFETLVECSGALLDINTQAGNPGFDYERFAETAMGTYDPAATYQGELFFKPDNLETFQTQLATIIAGVRTCAFEMDTAVRREAADRGAVGLELTDGSVQLLDYGVGWDLNATDDSIVEIIGEACDMIQNRDADLVQSVKIEFPCDVRVPKMAK